MREWVPAPGSARARLLDAAMTAFGGRGYEDVGVTELATAAGVTTGSLYHHFGNKLGLYDMVRTEVERRVLDRMEGAAAAAAGGPAASRAGAALLVGFDYLVGAGTGRLLAEAHPERTGDPIEKFLAELTDVDGAPRGRLLAAAWRAALAAATDGAVADQVRAALTGLLQP